MPSYMINFILDLHSLGHSKSLRKYSLSPPYVSSIGMTGVLSAWEKMEVKTSSKKKQSHFV